MKPLIYLCGPINGCSDEEATGWRESFKEMYGGPTLDPMRRDYRGKEASSYREIVELDKLDIRISDILVARYDKPSVGTSMEVLYAHSLGRPVILWVDDSSQLSPWMRYHATSIVEKLTDALRVAASIYVRSPFT